MATGKVAFALKNGSQIFVLDGLYVVWCGLVYKVVQPVGVNQVSAGPPVDYRLLAWIVIWEVVVWNVRIQACLHIPLVFFFQGVPVVL